jgi:hypothetical protein
VIPTSVEFQKFKPVMRWLAGLIIHIEEVFGGITVPMLPRGSAKVVSLTRYQCVALLGAFMFGALPNYHCLFVEAIGQDGAI